MSQPEDIVTIKHKVFGLTRGKTAEEIEENMEYHTWKIYIDGAAQSLSRISGVKYTMNDPSFYSQVVTGNPKDKFSYEIVGYGSITIDVHIFLRDKPLAEPIKRNYEMDISQSEGSGMQVNLNEQQ